MNVPATFQALLNAVFQDQLRKNVLVLFDDMLIYSKMMEKHVVHLQMVLQKMVKHSLYAKRSKFQFGQSQIEYLGHIISRNGMSTDPSKVQVMKD